jgi:hypothetical protein
MNSDLIGSIYGRFSLNLHISSRSINKHGRHRQFLFLLCRFLKGTSYEYDGNDQVTVHLAKQFQRRRFFRNQPISNKNCLWRPCLTGRHEMSNLYRGPSIDASYQKGTSYEYDGNVLVAWFLPIVTTRPFSLPCK